jgi:hypothetical protein
LVFLIVTVVVFFHLLISFLVLDSNIQVSSSSLLKDSDSSGDFLQVFVDVILFNPGRGRGVTVWVEITHEPSSVSFSKTEYVQFDFKELKNLTFNFTLDIHIYEGDFNHKVWLTYPSSQD